MMDKKVPALGDQSPASYLETVEGANALRAAIMRMPR
ncbi:antitoxin Xre/MbcA/ParS toxin-binding domain-containing protein [Paenibacillus silvae]